MKHIFVKNIDLEDLNEEKLPEPVRAALRLEEDGFVFQDVEFSGVFSGGRGVSFNSLPGRSDPPETPGFDDLTAMARFILPDGVEEKFDLIPAMSGKFTAIIVEEMVDDYRGIAPTPAHMRW
jgi:hypothetical protein